MRPANNQITIITGRILDSQGKFLHADNEDSDQTAQSARADLNLLLAHMLEGTGTYSGVATHKMPIRLREICLIW